jgi:hypothetical protein
MRNSSETQQPILSKVRQVCNCSATTESSGIRTRTSTRTTSLQITYLRNALGHRQTDLPCRHYLPHSCRTSLSQAQNGLRQQSVSSCLTVHFIHDIISHICNEYSDVDQSVQGQSTVCLRPVLPVLSAILLPMLLGPIRQLHLLLHKLALLSAVHLLGHYRPK